MATIARMNVMLGMDSKDFERGVKDAASAGESLVSKLGKIGQGMTAGISLPLAGMAAAAVHFSTAFNESMANVASLGVASDRVAELKGNVQEMAIATGKSTDDLAGGLYQVISAFGDSADTASILEINAKAAAAGLASTTEAIDLTSAVTKGWGDTSAEAVQQAADLAQMTVQLGQTTFPELAGSVGKVVPLMASLGGSQEELFGVMATATGVTGGAAEVSTQLRGVLQSLMAPTDSMTELMQSMGYETGAALLQGEGLQGTIVAVTKAAEASGAPLQSYIGSVEGQTLALALAGPQADVYADKLAAMSGAVGASEKAFLAQTQGINKAGFTMKQLTIRAQVVAQKIGDGLAPALAAVLDVIAPLADQVVRLADWFATADTNTQMWVVGIAAAVAAIGPLLTILPAVATAAGVLFGPVGLAIAAVAALGAAWVTNFGGIQQKTQAVIKALQPAFAELQEWIDMAMKGDFSGLTGKIGDTLQGIKVAIETFKWSDFIAPLADWGVYIVKLAWDTVITTLTSWGQWIASLDWSGFITKLADWGKFITATLTDWAVYVTKLDWGGFITKLADWGKFITATLTDWGTYVSKLSWGDYISKLWGDYVSKLSWSDYVSKLSWGDFVTKFDWALWIPALVWTVVITPVRWASWIPQLLWDNVISKLSWSGFIKAITNWNTWVTMLQWSALVFPVFWPTFIEKLGVTQWLAALGESPVWSSFIDKLNWLSVIPGLNWPDWVKAFKWGDFIPKLEWKIPAFPGWVDLLRALGWGGPPAATGTGNPNGTGGSSGTIPPTSSNGGYPIDVNAPYPEYRALGGAVSTGLSYWVGEKGPELFTPNRSGTIVPTHELGAWAADGEGQPLVVNNYNTIYNQIDVNELAYKVAGVFARRR